MITATASGIAATITVDDVQPGGTDGQVQYNDGGSFGGSADLTYNDATGRIGINSATPDRQLMLLVTLVLEDLDSLIEHMLL